MPTVPLQTINSQTKGLIMYFSKDGQRCNNALKLLAKNIYISHKFTLIYFAEILTSHSSVYNIYFMKRL